MNTVLPKTAFYLCTQLGYDKFLPTNSGVEACEAAIKLARKWGYTDKGVEPNSANIIVTDGCNLGRSITASGVSSDLSRSENFGPHTPGFTLVQYDDIDTIEWQLKRNQNTVAVMVEAI